MESRPQVEYGETVWNEAFCWNAGARKESPGLGWLVRLRVSVLGMCMILCLLMDRVNLELPETTRRSVERNCGLEKLHKDPHHMVMK